MIIVRYMFIGILVFWFSLVLFVFLSYFLSQSFNIVGNAGLVETPLTFFFFDLGGRIFIFTLILSVSFAG